MNSLPPAHHFTHEAMNTTFTLRLRAAQASYAADMARECFEHLEFLEARLSRYVDDSDVSRINHLVPGQTLRISECTHLCLLAALDGYARTGGLFDITLGRRIEHRKSGDTGDVPPLLGRLTIHPDIAAVTCDEPGREIDLGGIGKGFALDQLRDILIDWGAEDGLLTAGASSLLAFGPDAWPVELTGARETVRFALFNQSLSASGTGIQGSHILHPGGDDAMPSRACDRVWVVASQAALAEIWSTSLMLLEPEAIVDFLDGDETVTAVYTERDGKVSHLV
jgi:FAD:protein FMN transferase